MDDMTTRVVIIGVNIFITLTIVSLIIVMFFQMQDIYGLVSQVDTDIYQKFDDVYSMYDGKTETGIGLLNAIKRQEEDKEPFVIIKYPMYDKVREFTENNGIREVVKLKELMENNETFEGEAFRYENKYKVTVYEENGLLIVDFVKI